MHLFKAKREFTKTVNFFLFICVMFVIDLKSGVKLAAIVSKVNASDYKLITPSKFWFDWKAEHAYEVYKLCRDNTILGLISFESIDSGAQAVLDRKRFNNSH